MDGERTGRRDILTLKNRDCERSDPGVIRGGRVVGRKGEGEEGDRKGEEEGKKKEKEEVNRQG